MQIAPLLPVGQSSFSRPRKINNRDRIIVSSLELFNQCGVGSTTTNHIAQELGISPGNLYFHFRNKEAIIRELFDIMCEDVYLIWGPDKGSTYFRSPVDLIERSYEVFWRFRFFHREMYALRRNDPLLAKRWRVHIARSMRLLKSMYSHWVKEGVMRELTEPRELQMISDTVLITSSTFLQFFESRAKPATRKSLKAGLDHLILFLLPYHTPENQPPLRQRLGLQGGIPTAPA